MNKSISSIERQVNSNILTVKELIEELSNEVKSEVKHSSKTKRDKSVNKDRLILLKNIQKQLNILRTEIRKVYNYNTNNTNSTEQDTLF